MNAIDICVASNLVLAMKIGIQLSNTPERNFLEVESDFLPDVGEEIQINKHHSGDGKGVLLEVMDRRWSVDIDGEIRVDLVTVPLRQP